ncbi:TIR domain-containing protein [Streptomyces gilvus]|uniref:TIR domain-containing protein n=1 Tax=Streptomyces gilvus TaxID=2920937 RepID=UPI001F0FE419|nr:toll/interleukin-1 receptor domain-containing protein [Streptomyces sp. CME 23]MCH5676905.1 toll/interleukin-1 receptor domain-containing protein [Streptomyces sp. CME 23]
MTNEQPAGFWSYTHRDDELDGGRIVRLSERIASAFEMITGEPLEIFLDKRSIEWGDAWRARLDSALTGTTFLIPVVTPKFLKSQECRREVIKFAGHAASLGLDELLLPIHYVNVPQLTQGSDGQPIDEVVELISRRQWEDWRDLRLEDEDSPVYRQAVHKLALKIANVLETAPPVRPVELPQQEATAEEPPGFIEVMAEAETALPAWLEIVEKFAAVIQVIGAESSWATEEIANSDARGGGFAGRMRVAEQLSTRLTEPVKQVDTLGSEYWSTLSSIDPGIIGFIRHAGESDLSTEDREAARDFFKEVKQLAAVTKETTAQLQDFSNNIGETARSSSRLRPQFRTIQAAVQKVIDSQTVLDEWTRMIDETDLGEDDQP